MSFAKEASKLFTNKYFLYFMVFLAASNVLGYLVTNKFNAVIFFALVSLLTYQFSKNMSVVLLVSIIATNFLMANRRMREGLDNQDPTSSASNSTASSTVPALNNIDAKDTEISENIPKVQASSSNDELSNQSQENKNTAPSSNIIDPNNPDKNMKTNESEPVGAGAAMPGKKGDKTGPRLDYAATIEESYANLDKILGSNSIKNLSTDTQRLMEQQTNLYKTMEQMMPMIQNAKGMLDKLNVSGFTDTLKSMNLGSSPVVPNN